MDNFHVREATTEDRDHVLRINDNVYFGFDYIESYYDYFVTSQHTTPFVLLHENTIIGFTAAQIIDDGKTFVTRAARINPNYEGKGLYRYLDDFVGKWAQSKNVLMKTFATADHNSYISKLSFRCANRLLGTKNIIIYSVEPAALKNRGADAKLDSSLDHITDAALEALITSEDSKHYLFPSERVVVDTVPYQLMKANVPLMRGPNNSIVAFSDVRKENDTYSGLLSFGTLYRIKQPALQYTIELYGNDESSLRPHLSSHLKNLFERVDQKTCIVFYLGKQIPVETIDKIVSEYGIKRDLASNIHFTEQFLFEKSVK